VRPTIDGPIAASLKGRLGNQLFQFAAALSLQPDDRPVPVDSRWAPPGSGGRGSLFACLRREAVRELSQSELVLLGQVPRLLRGSSRIERLRAAAARRLPIIDSRIFTERSPFSYDSRVLALRGPILLSGYFQNEQYFRDVRAKLRSAFRPASTAARAWWMELERRAAGRRLVAVAFRDAPDYAALGWVLPDHYYRAALTALSVEPGECVFAVFGDSYSHNMARAISLLGEDLVLASAHGLSVPDQLSAQSMFDTQIIANSTFSWWGAWLADADRGFTAEIVAPAPWVGADDEGPVPARWRAIRRTVGPSACR